MIGTSPCCSEMTRPFLQTWRGPTHRCDVLCRSQPFTSDSSATAALLMTFLSSGISLSLSDSHGAELHAPPPSPNGPLSLTKSITSHTTHITATELANARHAKTRTKRLTPYASPHLLITEDGRSAGDSTRRWISAERSPLHADWLRL